MPFTYSAVRRVLVEAASGMPSSWAPSRVLDYGAGPGTAGLAAAATWPGAGTAGWVAVERSRRARLAYLCFPLLRAISRRRVFPGVCVLPFAPGVRVRLRAAARSSPLAQKRF